MHPANDERGDTGIGVDRAESQRTTTDLRDVVDFDRSSPRASCERRVENRSRIQWMLTGGRCLMLVGRQIRSTGITPVVEQPACSLKAIISPFSWSSFVLGLFLSCDRTGSRGRLVAKYCLGQGESPVLYRSPYISFAAPMLVGPVEPQHVFQTPTYNKKKLVPRSISHIHCNVYHAVGTVSGPFRTVFMDVFPNARPLLVRSTEAIHNGVFRLDTYHRLHWHASLARQRRVHCGTCFAGPVPRAGRGSRYVSAGRCTMPALGG